MAYKFLLTTFILFSQNVYAANSCIDLFAPLKTPFETVSHKVEWVKKTNFLSLKDKTDAFSFQASLNPYGTLSFSIHLTSHNLQKRSFLKGKNLYRQMIQHFGIERIHRITGTWVEGTNYDQYFSLLELGYSPEQAAANTWSGKQAALYGYSKIEAVEIIQNNLTGIRSVHVTFIRP